MNNLDYRIKSHECVFLSLNRKNAFHRLFIYVLIFVIIRNRDK
ncbi:hypothetical protein GCWU000282_00903 [Catonella morbi ATCC 51271]|uniref:Uncharacterized protein n=1 Tax=Catonella morbi ATCC 51271 TaxID=592026 RepID=V2Y472_9FIRM|nr:hypothetical protein GCWU000282_00903 [Catonella morbi ATCC 51271]